LIGKSKSLTCWAPGIGGMRIRVATIEKMNITRK